MEYACAIVNGTVKCWGVNSYGQIGDGTTTDHSLPTQVSGFILGAAQIGTGVNHSCGIKENKIWCWGLNTYGQLGNGTTTDSTTPTMVNNN